MAMTPRRKRVALIVGGLAALGLAAALVLDALRSNLMFFFSPSQVARHEAPAGALGAIVGPRAMRRITQMDYVSKDS